MLQEFLVSLTERYNNDSYDQERAYLLPLLFSLVDDLIIYLDSSIGVWTVSRHGCLSLVNCDGPLFKTSKTVSLSFLWKRSRSFFSKIKTAAS